MNELPTSKTVTKQVEEGMRLRHAEVERASDKLSTAGAMAYLSHLDRGELLAEVERLRNALSQSIETVKRLMAESRPDETSALPHASAALKDFMVHLGEIMSMEDGATPADYLQRARDIREWCHDHQTLPKLEYSEHCGCCVRNKITVEVFGRPAVEPAREHLHWCAIRIGKHCNCHAEGTIQRLSEKATERRVNPDCGVLGCTADHSKSK